ncbi:hypothetical protein BB559_002880 [Furculomyces boomerangus]|uniref:GPI inositol-deacylase n=2 Tax=Harpellales TaxID=61421 RepID=A0A2T9YRN5_9FUNG|nr:hypothetical protein BB559_002880 [Furculomyces boomerangus]PWA00928.1 hypothetical protein BB558_003003 [Smittium angustum]
MSITAFLLKKNIYFFIPSRSLRPSQKPSRTKSKHLFFLISKQKRKFSTSKSPKNKLLSLFSFYYSTQPLQQDVENNNSQQDVKNNNLQQDVENNNSQPKNIESKKQLDHLSQTRLKHQTEQLINVVTNNGLDMPVKPIYIAPRNPVFLCPGLYGFDVKGPASIPFLQTHYWPGIADALKKIGTDVHVVRVSGTGGIRQRVSDLYNQINKKLNIDPLTNNNFQHSHKLVNLVGHSMGGLDARYLISNVLPKINSGYSVSSLTTISSPHQGSPFMDWCREYLGLGNIMESENIDIFQNSNAKKKENLDSNQNNLNLQIAKVLKSVVSDTKTTFQQDLGLDCTQNNKDKLKTNNELNLLSNDQKLALMDMRDVKANDVRLGEFVEFLEDLMNTNSWKTDGKNGKAHNFEIRNSFDEKIIKTIKTPHNLNKSPLVSDSTSTLKNNNNNTPVGSTGWGVIGGSNLSQSVVLLRQIFTRIMHLVDTPAYSVLTTDYCKKVFNPSTPMMPNVSYYSYGAKINTKNLNNYLTPLWFPHSIVYKREGDNDGLVSLTSASYGEYVETLECDHFDLTNKNRLGAVSRMLLKPLFNLSSNGNYVMQDSKKENGKLNGDFDPIEFYLRMVTRLYSNGH